MKDSLSFVYQQQKELGTFGEISALLGWDQMTYMPSKAAADRSKQLSLLSRLAHEKVTSDSFYKHITHLTRPDIFEQLKKDQQLVLSRLKKDVDKARKIPSSFVEKMAKTTTLAYQAWEQARSAKKYSVFAPHLKQIITLEQEYCTYIDLPGPAYNSLLDDYEEGMTVDVLKREFHTLRKELTRLLEQLHLDKKQEIKPMSIPLEKQQQMGDQVLSDLLFPTDCARLDQSTHPFTTSLGRNDVRITTNYKQESPLFSFFSTIHEAGHALYELGLPQKEYADTVISDAPSLGLHESQSRFWENMIARSYPFWQGFYPKLQHIIGPDHISFTREEWYQHINAVRPSLIRVEADELTYCLHVILRFELELQLINGEIRIHDLPERWNETMQEYLGVTPKHDVEGVLQDMHWSGGSFGYFPTYAIGSIYAAQLYQALKTRHPRIEEDIRQNDFTRILQWLRTHIHQQGRKHTADHIIKKACGNSLHATTYLEYLKDKYKTIYQ